MFGLAGRGIWLAPGPVNDMTAILAHRANILGPCPATENSLAAIDTALAWGWGLETDMRRTRDGRFYISHDPRSSADGALAADVFTLLRMYPLAPVALNVKEIGNEADLLDLLERCGVLPQVFLFGMEAVEPRPGATARLLRRLHRSVRIAARVSDRDEPIEHALSIEAASIVWLDELDAPWCSYADVQRLTRAGKAVYALSPELHGAPLADARRRWMDFLDWGVDGICTDYPAELDYVMTTRRRGAA
jgi:hypothetical protein